MKKVIMVGMMLKGYRVTIEEGRDCFAVITTGDGYYECKGGIKTIEQTRAYYRRKIAEIRGEV